MSAIVRLIGVLHQTPILYASRLCVAVFLPHLAWSSNSLRKYAKSVVHSSMEARKQDPTISDVFGQFISAKDPDSGMPALTYTDVRVNSANFLIAGSSNPYPISLSIA
jgi:hypothetical protein